MNANENKKLIRFDKELKEEQLDIVAGGNYNEVWAVYDCPRGHEFRRCFCNTAAPSPIILLANASSGTSERSDAIPFIGLPISID